MVEREGRTIENRAGEERQELEEHILLLGGDFIVAEALATALNVTLGEALLDVGFEPIVRDLARILDGGGFAPKLPPRLLGVRVARGGGGIGLVLLGGELGVTVGGNVFLQGGVLVEIFESAGSSRPLALTRPVSGELSVNGRFRRLCETYGGGGGD